MTTSSLEGGSPSPILWNTHTSLRGWWYSQTSSHNGALPFLSLSHLEDLTCFGCSNTHKAPYPLYGGGIWFLRRMSRWILISLHLSKTFWKLSFPFSKDECEYYQESMINSKSIASTETIIKIVLIMMSHQLWRDPPTVWNDLDIPLIPRQAHCDLSICSI